MLMNTEEKVMNNWYITISKYERAIETLQALKRLYPDQEEYTDLIKSFEDRINYLKQK